MNREPNITDAFAEWDDRASLFRVFLTAETGQCADEDCRGCDACEGSQDLFLEAEHFPETALMVRLYKAAFCANPKDFKGLKVQEPIGWAKRPPAERAAKAVKRELELLKEGEARSNRYRC